MAGQNLEWLSGRREPRPGLRILSFRLEAITTRIEAIAIAGWRPSVLGSATTNTLKAIAIRSEVIAITLDTIASRLEAIAIRLEAVTMEAAAIRLEAIAIRF